MKFNLMLLIIFCLLQVLNSSIDGLNEQTLIDATNKILKYAKIYHEEWMNLEDKENLYDLKLYCPSLILDNIQFSFDENGNLHIQYVNLKLVVTGKYNYGIGFSHIVNDFRAALNNLHWSAIFEISKEELEDGKLDIKYKQVASSDFKYDVMLLSHKAIEIKDLNISLSIEDSLKDLLKKNIGFRPLENQLYKVNQLILETVRSDLK
jgi:hypothetical protein